MDIDQKIIFHNKSKQGITHLIVYDWNNSYSQSDTPLSKKLYDEYNLSLVKSEKKKRGLTKVNKISSGSNELNWNRIQGSPDLIKIFFSEELKSNQKIEINVSYTLVFPRSKVFDYGYVNNGSYTIKNFLLRVTPIIKNISVAESNLNLDDQFNTEDHISMNIEIPSNYTFHCNVNHSESEINKLKKISFETNKIKNLTFFIFTNNEFEEIDNEFLDIITNEKKILSIKSESLERIHTFLSNNFNNYSKSKLLLTKKYFKEYSLYPFSDLPTYLKVFDQNSINEINLFKIVLRDFIRSSIGFSDRKYFWVRSGMEFYYLEKYILDYNLNLKIFGALSNNFFVRNHEISKQKINDIFNISQLYVKRLRLDQRISEEAQNLTRINYRLVNPSKSLNAFKLLELYDENLVDQTFKTLINDKIIFDDVEDLKNIFKSASKKDLNWFFNDYINMTEPLDYKITQKQKKILVSEKSKNEINVPIPIRKEFINNNITTEIVHLKDTHISEHNYLNNLKKITVDPDNIFVDINLKNNHLNFNSSRKKLKPRFFTDIESRTENHIYYRPQFGYNFYDGLLPGFTLTNRSPVSKPFTYIISPYYGLKKNKLAGALSFNYRAFIKKNIIMNYYLSASSFHYNENYMYKKLTPSISYIKKDPDLKSNKYTSLRFKYYFIDRPDTNQNEKINNIYSLSFTKANPGGKKTKFLNFNFQLNRDFIKNSITLYYRNYFSDYRQFSIRFFGGKFIKNKTRNNQINFSIHNSTDFLLNNSLLGRSETDGFLSQQYIRQEGAFKSRINPDYADDFIIVFNTGLTIWKWVEFYGDFGLFKNKNMNQLNGYDLGIRLNFVEDYLELYFPIQSSNGFHPTQSNYLNNIRFVLTFDSQNLSKLFTRRWF